MKEIGNFWTSILSFFFNLSAAVVEKPIFFSSGHDPRKLSPASVLPHRDQSTSLLADVLEGVSGFGAEYGGKFARSGVVCHRQRHASGDPIYAYVNFAETKSAEAAAALDHVEINGMTCYIMAGGRHRFGPAHPLSPNQLKFSVHLHDSWRNNRSTWGCRNTTPRKVLYFCLCQGPAVAKFHGPGHTIA